MLFIKHKGVVFLNPLLLIAVDSPATVLFRNLMTNSKDDKMGFWSRTEMQRLGLRVVVCVLTKIAIEKIVRLEKIIIVILSIES